MLTEVKNNYKLILKHFNFDESISSADYKKQKLIEMANSGAERPPYKSKLGQALKDYSSKYSQTYNINFDKNIRKLRPDWFVSRTEKANQKKQTLINMAKDGKNRPGQKTKLGASLSSYTKSGIAHDARFTKIIKKLRPDWFINQSEKANQNKKILIKMAKDGKDILIKKTKLGMAFTRYTVKSSVCFDADFTKNIRKLRPDWLLNQTEKANQKKQLLIRIAKNGEDKPSARSKLGILLSNYVLSSSSTNLVFTKLIKKLRPDWFSRSKPNVNKNKQKIIDMAKNGMKRPNSKTTKEGCALSSYINKGHCCYCPKFDKLIRKLRPDWFKKCS